MKGQDAIAGCYSIKKHVKYALQIRADGNCSPILETSSTTCSFLCFSATGVAVSMVAARLGGIIGNVVIAALLDSYCPAPTFIVAVLLASGGLMCLFLPNTTRQALQ